MQQNRLMYVGVKYFLRNICWKTVPEVLNWSALSICCKSSFVKISVIFFVEAHTMEELWRCEREYILDETNRSEEVTDEK